MQPELTSELQKVATSTFEELGFLLPEFEVSEDQAEAPVTASSRVRFRGPASGALEIEVAGGFLLELAGNMLGVENPSPGEVELDALGEISNVICGNVLPHLSGPNAVYDLSAPEVSGEPLPPCATPEGRIARVAMGVGDGRAEITLRLYG